MRQALVLFTILIQFPLWVAQAFGTEAQVRKVTLEWEAVPESKAYELEFRRHLAKGGLGKYLFFKSMNTSWTGAINPGLYQVRMRSQDDRGVWGEWSEPFDNWVRVLPPDLMAPKDNAVLSSDESEKTAVEFSWKNRPGATSYRLEIFNDQNQLILEKNLDEVKFKTELAVAQEYRWRVTSLMHENKELGDVPERMWHFVLRGGPLPSPEIERPEDQFVTSIKWRPAVNAQAYNVELFRFEETKKKWVLLEKRTDITDTSLSFDSKHAGGRWKLSVQSTHERFDTSRNSEMEFPVYDGERTAKAIAEAKARQALESARDQYWIASYLISSVDYSAKFADLPGIQLKFGALTGTGRVGYGHFGRRAKWGAVAILDYGGMVINNKNHTFGTFELQGIWRGYINGVTQIRAYGGLGFRERPIAKGLTSNSVKVENGSTLDATLGAQQWHPFTKRFGMQLNQQVHYNVSGANLPSGAALKPALTYQFGFMGSYKLREDVTGFAGYAYRHDDLSFTPKGYSGVTHIVIDGHYLNLHLEWGF